MAFIYSYLFIHLLVYTVEPCLTDTPEKRPSTMLRTLHLVPNVLTCLCVQSSPCTAETPVKRTGSPVPTVPELYKIQLIIWTLVYCFRKIVCHIRWIQRPGIISTLSLIMHANLSQPCMAMEMSENAPWSYSPARVHHTHQSTPEATEIRMSPYYIRHTKWWS